MYTIPVKVSSCLLAKTHSPNRIQSCDFLAGRIQNGQWDSNRPMGFQTQCVCFQVFLELYRHAGHLNHTLAAGLSLLRFITTPTC